MEKKFNLKVSARIRPNSHHSVQSVSFNQLILRGQSQEETKKLQVDKIYLPTDQNEKLFENILRVPTNLMIEGISSVVLCLGGPNSGKTYTLAGKIGYSFSEISEPGIMIYIMRRLFSKFKHEVSLYSTYSFWCKFCFVEHDQVTYFNLNDKQKGDYIDKEKGLIEIKSYSHFQEIISSVYRNNNSNKRHTIIEFILQKGNTFHKVTKSSITFVEFGSFFYNCPYREAEELSMENDIESVLNVMKNLSRSRENSNQLFGASLLTKILQQNFLNSTSFELIGLLDECHENNIKTANFLDIVMLQKEDRNMIKNFREQIKRQQVYLKNLFEKHRKVLNLLSRCIGMELGYLEKQKKTRNFQGPILNTFYKTCEKIKYANTKKLQNEKTIEEIEKSINQQINQLNKLDQEYEEKILGLAKKEKNLKMKKEMLESHYQEIISPNIKLSNVDNSLFWRLEDKEAKEGNKYHTDDETVLKEGVDSEWEEKVETRATHKAIKGLPTEKMIGNKNIMKMDAMYRNHGEKYERNDEKVKLQLSKKRLAALKAEIVQIFSATNSLDVQIQRQAAKLPSNHHILISRVKNRHEGVKFNKSLIEECIKSMPDPSCIQHYKQIIEDNKIQEIVDREVVLPATFNNNMLSNKSMKSEKSLKH